MKAAELFDLLIAGAHVQMVGVGKLHLGTDLLQILGGNGALDGSRCSDVHENGGVNGSVNRFKLSESGFSFLF